MLQKAKEMFRCAQHDVYESVGSKNGPFSEFFTFVQRDGNIKTENAGGKGQIPSPKGKTTRKSIKKYGGKAVILVNFLQNKCTRNSIFRVHFSFIRIPPSVASVKQIAKIS